MRGSSSGCKSGESAAAGVARAREVVVFAWMVGARLRVAEGSTLVARG